MAKHVAPATNAQKGEKVRRRKRGRLVAIIVLLVIIVAALGVSFAMIVNTTSQNAQTSSSSSSSSETIGVTDATASTDKTVSLPGLVGVLGRTSSEAVEMLGHGARVTSTKDGASSGSDYATEVTIVLDDEPENSLAGKPKVYLSLNEYDVVVRAGASAAVADLGYGSATFKEVVNDKHIVENTMAEVGIDLPTASISLPADTAEYTTCDDAGNITLESYGFEGTTEVYGVTISWEAAVVYDYAKSGTARNLAKTSRLIYVYAIA